MLPFRILCLSLFIIPLAGTLIIGPFLSIPNAGQAKNFLILISILSIVISSTQCCRVPIKPNISLYLLMIFLPLSIYSAPPLRLMYGNGNLGNQWIWKGLAWVFVYFMAYLAIQGMRKDKELLAKCIGWTAIISAAYAYLQAMGLDQFQFTRPHQHIGSPVAANITSMIGNPTFLGVFLCICLPFLWLFFKKRWSFFVAGAVLLVKSDFAYLGLAFIPLAIACLRARRLVWLKAVSVLALGLIITVAVKWGEIRPMITDNSRFSMWEQVWEDWKEPCIQIPITGDMTKAQKIEVETLNKRNHAFTGRGLGSFPHIFGVSHNSPWEAPHNIYLHCLYTIGLIGTVLFILSIGFVFLKGFLPARTDPYYLALYVSFAYICLAAIGTPMFNCATLQFYSAVMFCLLSSNSVEKKSIKKIV